jgi:hypothetical protein
MTEIPEDVMQKAEEAYTASLHDSMAGKPDYLKHVGLAILAERDGWQDIGTAPKDGSPVWVAHTCGWMDPAYFRHAGKGFWVNIYTRLPVEWRPSHWRTLPKPPVSSAKAGDSHD